KKLTLVDKANVLESSRLWRRVVTAVGKSYDDVTLDFLFVDNAAMQLIVNPAQFDIILTSNMFGDILSDEASVITGSLGMLPSASVGASTPLFEPVHGSYPQAAGQDRANPMATILSGAMLLDHLGEHEGAEAIRKAVQAVLEAGLGTEDLSPDIPYKCSQIGDLVSTAVQEGPDFKFQREKLQHGVSTII
ncbi:MAG: 3-isopropylmalate dehydrogenase, partial [Phaeodactylibacter sp.]|nr:3-isopropylmalate dehydrogenase [Phaeodactylibacter sp.]